MPDFFQQDLSVSLVLAEAGVLVGILDEHVFKAGALLGFEELRLAEELGALLLPVDFVPVVAVDFRQEVVQLELLLMTAYHPIAMKVGYL